MKKKLLPEALTTASFLNDLAATARSKLSAQELWDGKKSKWTSSHLIEFGRVGLVKIKTKITGKLDDKAEAMIMVEYGTEYSVGTKKIYNPKTKRFVFSDSFTWCKFKRWEEHPSMDGVHPRAKNMTCNGIDDNDGKTTVSLEDDDTECKVEALEEGHILRRSKRIAGIPADGPPVTDGTHKVTGDTTVRTIHLDEGVGIVDASKPKSVNFIFNTSINSDPGEPKSILEALNGADKKWWKLSEIAEVNNFLSRGAWKFILKSSVPDRKLVGTKAVLR